MEINTLKFYSIKSKLYNRICKLWDRVDDSVLASEFKKCNSIDEIRELLSSNKVQNDIEIIEIMSLYNRR